MQASAGIVVLAFFFTNVYEMPQCRIEPSAHEP
jgi:hypothetical protein